MIHFDLPKEKSSIIKVIGVGVGQQCCQSHVCTEHRGSEFHHLQYRRTGNSTKPCAQ